MSTKQKPPRARPADPADAAPASLDVTTGADGAHAGAADAFAAAGAAALAAAADAARGPGPDAPDACGLCGSPAEYTALRVDGAGPVLLCRGCLGAAAPDRAPTYDELAAERAALRAELGRARAPLEAASLRVQETDAEALQALCAAQRQHPQDKVARAIGILALRIAERVLA